MRASFAILCLLAATACGQISCGDCNGDGIVASIIDALRASQMGAGLVVPTMDEQCSCDVDDSGVVTVLDALVIAQNAAGVMVGMTCPRTPCGNSPPIVTITDPTGGTRAGVVRITFDTIDIDADPLNLVFEIALGGPFMPATSAGTGSVTSNPAMGTTPGLQQTFAWDSLADAVALAAPEMVTFRVSATDTSMASGDHSVVFTVDNTTPTTWVELFPPISPPARSGHAMAYDSVAQVTVMFGGRDAVGYLADTWAWDGATWTQLFPPTSPSGRYRMDMAHDPVRGGIIMFGGNPGGDETWQWTGTTWTQRMPTTSPSFRSGIQLAFDQTLGTILCFGGGGYTDETWSWDGFDWTLLLPPTAPSPRSYSAMDFDRGRGQMVLQGGYIFSGVAVNYDDTWIGGSGFWAQLMPVTSPPGLLAPTMTHDPGRSIMLLACGSTTGATGGAVDETWIWDGQDWMQETPATAPPARVWHTAVFDEARGVHFLFGGALRTGGKANDSWVW